LVSREGIVEIRRLRRVGNDAARRPPAGSEPTDLGSASSTVNQLNSGESIRE
jgi:hypothetical protein